MNCFLTEDYRLSCLRNGLHPQAECERCSPLEVDTLLVLKIAHARRSCLSKVPQNECFTTRSFDLNITFAVDSNDAIMRRFAGIVSQCSLSSAFVCWAHGMQISRGRHRRHHNHLAGFLTTWATAATSIRIICFRVNYSPLQSGAACASLVLRRHANFKPQRAS